jgi:DNA repair protein RecO (recombination protein O)
MNLIPARGFVLTTRPFAEADKIAQIYTLSLGKVKALVKGVRKPKSKLSSAMNLFTESSFSLHKKGSGDLFGLSQAKVLNAYSDLKEDFQTITSLQMLADILVQSLHDTEPHPEIYSLIQTSLEALKSRKAERELILSYFALKLLELMGYPLELEACCECGTSLQGQRAHLIPHRGGALCESCCPSGPGRLKITPGGLATLQRLKSLPIEKIHILKLQPEVLRGLFLTSLDYLERTIEKKLQTLEYYSKVILVT